MPNLFQTNSGAPSATIGLSTRVQNVDWFKRALLQALYLMTDANNWRQQGAEAESIDSAVQFANQLILSLTWGDTTMRQVGEFMDYAGEIDPMPESLLSENWLWCNGAELLIEDYPELYAVIGRKFTFPETPVEQFSLPDYRDRSPMYAAADTQIGVYDGNAEISLNINELPPHTHTLAGGAVGGAANVLPVIGASGAARTATTGSAGSGEPFSIVHPVLIVHRLIKAK